MCVCMCVYACVCVCVCVCVCLCAFGAAWHCWMCLARLLVGLSKTDYSIFAEQELPDSHCVFSRGRSCTDQIISPLQITEKLYKNRTPDLVLFIDLRKAYDSVPREAVATPEIYWCTTQIDGDCGWLPRRHVGFDSMETLARTLLSTPG